MTLWLLVSAGVENGALAVLVLMLACLSGLLSAAEASLIGAPAWRRQRLGESISDRRSVQLLLSKPNRLLVTVLVANYLVNVGAAVIVAYLTVGLLGGTTPLALFVAVGLATATLLVFGEFVPRAVATVAPAATARTVAPLLVAVQWVLLPLVWMFEQFSRLVFGLVGAPFQRRVFLDDDELKQMLAMGQAQGVLEKGKGEMISKVIDFSRSSAGDIMVPRIDMVAVDDRAALPEVVTLLNASGYSRIPVFHDDLDNIVGVVYIKDVLAALQTGTPATIQQLMKPPLLVPETRHLDEVLQEMKDRRVHIGIVHDEFGGTAGLVTLEDILEEIVGDILDEYDPASRPIDWQGEGIALLDARMGVQLVNEALGVDIPLDEGYETLGGFMFHHFGRPGRTGEVVRRFDVEFRVERVANRRIVKVRATKLKESAGQAHVERG